MSAPNKKNTDSIKGTTPIGIAKWASLHKPDTQFKAEGEYRVTLLLDGEAAEKMKKIIDDAITASGVKARAENPKVKTIKRADPPYKPYVDKDGNATELTAFNFKAKASGTRKDGTAWAFRPSVFDAKGIPVGKDVQVWGGSKVKVAYELRPFYTQMVGAGIQAKLSAVQVIELVTGSWRSADSFGFSSEEGYDGAAAGGEQAGGAGADAQDGSEF